MNNEPTVAQEIASALKRHGVEILFAQSLPSMVALSAEDLKIRQFTYRTENAGAAMADAIAPVTSIMSTVAGVVCVYVTVLAPVQLPTGRMPFTWPDEPVPRTTCLSTVRL